MTDKAYIVANEQQEKSLLAKLEQQGCSWNDTENTPPTEWHLGRYPYAIFVKYGKKLVWGFNVDVSEVEIVFDGRKEEQMSDKYVVSQEFMYGLEEWRKNKNLINELIWYTDIKSIPKVVKEWWAEDFVDKTKTNNRLIAIIRWVNGEDVFEVEKTKKWVVRSKGIDEDGDYGYVLVGTHGIATTSYNISRVTKFDTKEEAESWANSHQEVVEVE